MMKKIIFLGMLILLIGISYGTYTVNLLDDSGNVNNNLYYNSHGNYKNIRTIEVCSDTDNPAGKWVALFYTLGDNSKYVAVSKNLSQSGGVLVKLGNNYSNNGLNCANASSDEFAIIDSIIQDPYGIPNEPAFFPAKVWAVVADGPNILDSSTSPQFLPTDITFKGSYSLNSYKRTYNPVTGYIHLDISKIIAYGTGNNFNVNQPSEDLVVGTCEDNQGTNCHDVEMENQSILSSGINLQTGYSNNVINDQNYHKMFLLVNGIPYNLDLGADLIVSSISYPSIVYWGQKVPISVNITNIGNVNVTSSFNVELIYNDSNGYSQTFTKTISSQINANGGIYTINFNEPWKFSLKGTGTITVKVDSTNNINETDESNNELSKSVDLESSYNITMVSLVDNSPIGTTDSPFPYSKTPYGVNILVKENPQNTFSSLNVYLIEEDGVNILDPEVSNSKVIVTLNIPSDGLNTTIVPSKINNNYRLYFSGLKFYNGTDVVDEIPIYVSSTSDNMDQHVGIANKNLIENMLNYFGRIYYHLYKAIV